MMTPGGLNGQYIHVTITAKRLSERKEHACIARRREKLTLADIKKLNQAWVTIFVKSCPLLFSRFKSFVLPAESKLARG
jgi:hypothetical protein